MIKNTKGLTLFEVLISISVSSIVLITLMSILTTTLLTKNEIDYTNRLNDEVYFMTESINTNINNLGYRSIVDETPVDVTDHKVYVITEEYEFVLVDNVTEVHFFKTEPDFLDNHQFVMHLDLVDGALYYGPRSQFDMTNLTFLNKDTYRLTSERVTVQPTSTLDYDCLATFNLSSEYRPELYATCSSAFIALDLELTYTLNSGGILDPRQFYTTLFF